MGDRVRIGACHGPADAAVVRAMLSAHGIESVVGGEMHANMLGGLGGPLIALDITVAAEDAEEAVALLREFRADVAATPAEHEELDADDSAPDLRFEQRKRTGVALLLAFCITFGTAHFYARHWVRGLMLAVLEIVAFTWLGHARAQGGTLLAACIVADAVGAIWSIKAAAKTNLPVARTTKP